MLTNFQLPQIIPCKQVCMFSVDEKLFIEKGGAND